MRHRARALQLVLTLAVGCDPAEVAPDAAVGEDAAIVRDDASVDAGPSCEDGNDGPAEAADARLGSTGGVTGAIDCPGDVDWFAFDGVEGEFVRLYVRPARAPDGRVIDPVLTLFDPDGQRMAENDDGMEGAGPIGTHPLILTRLPVSGRYVARVDDYHHWSGEGTPVGAPDLAYRLVAVRIDETSADAVRDPETGDDAASATPLRFLPRTLAGTPIDFGYAVGTFDHPGDVDVYAFEITGATGSVALGATAHVPGPDGSGATTRPGHLWITDAAGAVVFARTDTSAQSGLIRVLPSLPDGTYRLWVDRSAQAPGDNDFYAIAVARHPFDNPRESTGTANDALAGADPLALEAQQDLQVGAWLSFLPEGDVDYFSFPVPETRVIADVACSSAWDGSGLRGLRVELRDASDAVITARNEDDMMPAQLRLDPVPFPDMAAGTYYVRLSAADRDPTIAGDWVRCVVVIRPVP